jgi:polyvinyl alcohol dehydrogenase (cytochrome)
VWALDPDNKGAVVWTHKVGRGSALGGLEWGSALTNRSDIFRRAAQAGPAGRGRSTRSGSRPGEEVWHVDPPARFSRRRRCSGGVSGRRSPEMPGAVFSGTTDGMLRAYSTTDGKVLW